MVDGRPCAEGARNEHVRLVKSREVGEGMAKEGERKGQGGQSVRSTAQAAAKAGVCIREGVGDQRGARLQNML